MQIKGNAVQSIADFVKERFGEDGFKRWLAALPAAARDDLKSALLATSWYPVESHYVVPTMKVCELFYGGDLKGAWDAGSYNAHKAITGAYKSLIRVGEPNYITSKASIFLSQMYSPSESDVFKNDPGIFILHITKLPVLHQALEMRVAGFVEKALEASGAKNVKVEVAKSMCHGDPLTEIRATWTV